MNDIVSKLSVIQQSLNAPKSQYNKFGGYNFRNCEDILEALKPLLGDTVIVIDDEIVLVGDRYYVKATACLSDGKEKISATAYARETEEKKGMDSAQITGAASSYARKYALNALFAIDDSKDPDNQDNSSQHKPIRGKRKEQAQEYVAQITNAIKSNDNVALLQLDQELKEDMDLYSYIGGLLTSQQKTDFRTLVHEAAQSEKDNG